MYTNCDEWLRIECRHCKYFKVNAEMNNVESTCKRLDHKRLRFAKKIFMSYDCGCCDINTCADFEPDEKKVPWLYNHWNDVKKQIIPYSKNDYVALNIDGNSDVRYLVRGTDFYNNTFINKDGSLKWIAKYYAVRDLTRPTKQRIVYEYSEVLP